MIVFELICSGQHRFEGWFASADEFTSQKHRGLLICPVCSDHSIEKLLTAKIGRTESTAAAVPARDGGQAVEVASGNSLQGRLQELLDHVLTHSEDVGAGFAEEARKIHYQEAQARDIRGTATADQTRELLEEGIPVLPLPIPRRRDWH